MFYSYCTFRRSSFTYLPVLAVFCEAIFLITKELFTETTVIKYSSRYRWFDIKDNRFAEDRRGTQVVKITYQKNVMQ